MSTYIPARIRGPLYAIYAVIGVALGAIQVGFASANAGQPAWLTVALSVFAFLGGAIGYTAASNTPAEQAVVVVNAGAATYSGDSKADAAYHDGGQ